MRNDFEMGELVYDHAVDLAAHTEHAIVELNTLHDYINEFPLSPEAYIEGVFARSLLVAQQPKRNSQSPRFLLTQRSRDFGERRGLKPQITASDLDDVACLEAELRLLRSINKQHSGGISSSHNAHPAAIIYGTDGEPCGYQKNNGLTTTYIWRDATVATAGGAYELPADSFVNLDYEPGNDPRFLYSGIGLLAIQKELPLQSITFLRFSTANFPGDIRKTAHNDACLRANKLYQQEQQVIYFTPATIQNAIAKLLKQDKAFITKT